MTATKIYSFTVPAGGAFQLQAIGDYFKIGSASGLVEVRGDTFGTIGALLPGQGLSDTPFGRLEFRDLSGMPNAVTIVVADQRFVDDRISGDVSVIDGDKLRNIAGGGYAGSANAGPVAAQYSSVQLWNPAGSGRRIVVQSVTYSTATADSIFTMAFSLVQLPTVFNVPSGNKLGGGVAGVGELRTHSKVTVDAEPMGRLRNDFMSASMPSEWAPKGMLIVPPGMGLNVAAPVLNQRILANFEWVEEFL